MLAHGHQTAVCKTVKKGGIPSRDANFISSIGGERYTLMAARKELPNRHAGRNTHVLDHFKPPIRTNETLIPQAEASMFVPLLMSVQLARISGPIFPQLNSVCRQRPRTVEIMAGNRVQCAGEFSERSLEGPCGRTPSRDRGIVGCKQCSDAAVS